jgi:hypothetical protein
VTRLFVPSPWHLQRMLDAATAKCDGDIAEARRRRAAGPTCRSCRRIYVLGDGFDDECPECADTTDQFLKEQD